MCFFRLPLFDLHESLGDLYSMKLLFIYYFLLFCFFDSVEMLEYPCYSLPLVSYQCDMYVYNLWECCNLVSLSLGVG